MKVVQVSGWHITTYLDSSRKPSEADDEGGGFRLQSYLRPLKRSAERSGP
jgi:hypothetical protein